ncbi:DNA/RNA nuclease SfsA [Vallitalea okinawensis]|uniref:DNA/RNA nuclease SfsA n=1 Tax=Vallitalea okinawensis TaxID=2078660 RepID=UPI000CFCB34D|nr:DNA/RNA nuclease SfsA [Vallitalea okinawensis]
MQYKNDIIEATFLERPNRFIAHVLIDGKEEVVHVKNTGRCREILVEGVKVYLEQASNPNRKTKYSLISAYKGERLINIDSQIPNAIIENAVKDNKIKGIDQTTFVKREVTYGKSRFDLYYETEKSKGFIEVKGATLEIDGMITFPDAPTERGTKHVLEMIDAVKAGYEGSIIFLVQMKDVDYFTPNKKMDPDFSKALKRAHKAGVRILAYDCIVTKDSIEFNEEVPVVFK